MFIFIIQRQKYKEKHQYYQKHQLVFSHIYWLIDYQTQLYPKAQRNLIHIGKCNMLAMQTIDFSYLNILQM